VKNTIVEVLNSWGMQSPSLQGDDDGKGERDNPILSLNVWRWWYHLGLNYPILVTP